MATNNARHDTIMSVNMISTELMVFLYMVFVILARCVCYLEGFYCAMVFCLIAVRKLSLLFGMKFIVQRYFA